ncbi:MAG: fimbrial biogenesis outer membrane usher protein [Deltaproteobacteria bacterium]|nr:fimbrial biogenesis outer membrane usher protein [Deltaproteobacteria bacterium]
MLEYLKDWISADRINQLSAHLVADPRTGERLLAADALTSVGLKPKFDESTLELRIEVPPDIRKTNLVYLSGRGIPPQIGEALAPSPFSGFVNTRVGEDFNFHHNDGTDGRRPFRSDLDGALNYKSWVIEAASNYTSQQDHTFTRGDVRLVKDDPAHTIRYAAGDLSYPISTYQHFRPMAGFTFASNFTLQPYRVTIPLSSNEIFLKTPSRVVVFINGFQSQVLYLPAGRQDLKSLALGNGINFVRLEITDDVGRVEVLNFPWVSDADLLTKGLHQLAYSVGFPSTQVGNHRDYNSSLPTVSIFHRYGLSDTLTVGANYQGDHRQLVGGVEVTEAHRWGTLGLEPTIGHLSGYKSALAGRLRYNYTDYNGPRFTQRNLLFGVEYKDAHFAELTDFDAIAPNVIPAVNLTAGYSQTVLPEVNARLSGTYDFNRGPGTVNDYLGSLALVKSWKSGMQASLTLTHRRSQTDQSENDLFFLLSWVMPESNHFVTASEDTARKAQRVEWHYNSPQLVGGYSAGASFERAPDANRTDASLDYTGNRGTLGASHNLTTNYAGYQQQTTNLRAGTSVAFAGGRFAIGRPITDAFAIVAVAEHLKGQTIDVNPNSNEYYDSRADCLGPAVVSNIRSYQYYHLYLDPSRLPPGLELGEENYALLPDYKSGVLIRAGTDAAIMLAGVLFNASHVPIALESGEALLKGDPNAKPIVVFTNRKGKFRVEGFKPGTYVLRFFSEKWALLEFSIPDTALGVYDIGSLTARPLR